VKDLARSSSSTKDAVPGRKGVFVSVSKVVFDITSDRRKKYMDPVVSGFSLLKKKKKKNL